MRSMPSLYDSHDYYVIKEISRAGSKIARFFDFLRGRCSRKVWCEFFEALNKPGFSNILSFFKDTMTVHRATTVVRRSPIATRPVPRSIPSLSPTPEPPFKMPTGTVEQWLQIYHDNQSEISKSLCSRHAAEQYSSEIPLMRRGIRRQIISEVPTDQRTGLLISYVREEGYDGWEQLFRAIHKFKCESLKDFWYTSRGPPIPSPPRSEASPCVVCGMPATEIILPCEHTVKLFCKDCQKAMSECFECSTSTRASTHAPSTRASTEVKPLGDGYSLPPGDSRVWNRILTNGGTNLEYQFSRAVIDSLTTDMKSLRSMPAANCILDATNPYKRKLFLENLRGGGHWNSFFETLHKTRKLGLLRVWYGLDYEPFK